MQKEKPLLVAIQAKKPVQLPGVFRHPPVFQLFGHGCNEAVHPAGAGQLMTACGERRTPQVSAAAEMQVLPQGYPIGSYMTFL